MEPLNMAKKRIFTTNLNMFEIAYERKIKLYPITDLVQCKSAGQTVKKKHFLSPDKATSSSAAKFRFQFKI